MAESVPGASVTASTAKMAPWWAKILVLWHVFAITAWACPKPVDKLLDGTVKPAPLALGDWIRIFDQNHLKFSPPVRDYILTIGAWQYWDMFAPNPTAIDYYGDSVIKYKDGSTRVSPYPRMASLSIPAKYLQERFRKFYERAHLENDYPYMFTAFAYREAIRNWKDPKNPPVEVSLRRYWHTVVAPGNPEDNGYHSYVYFIGVIDPKLLKQLKDGPP